MTISPKKGSARLRTSIIEASVLSRGRRKVGCCLWSGGTLVNSDAALRGAARQRPREFSNPTLGICLPNRHLNVKHLQNVVQIHTAIFWPAGKSHYISVAMN